MVQAYERKSLNDIVVNSAPRGLIPGRYNILLILLSHGLIQICPFLNHTNSQTFYVKDLILHSLVVFLIHGAECSLTLCFNFIIESRKNGGN